MPTALSHPAAAIGLFPWFGFRRGRWLIFILGAAACILPDADVIAFRYGIPYADPWGHRGMTHSIAFALGAAVLLASLVKPVLREHVSFRALVLYFGLCGLIHIVTDAMTNGGLGVALFAPFSNERYLLPWRPVIAAPLSLKRFFDTGGAEVLKSEFFALWIPSIALGLAGIIVKKYRPLVQGKIPGDDSARPEP